MLKSQRKAQKSAKAEGSNQQKVAMNAAMSEVRSNASLVSMRNAIANQGENVVF